MSVAKHRARPNRLPALRQMPRIGHSKAGNGASTGKQRQVESPGGVQYWSCCGDAVKPQQQQLFVIFQKLREWPVF
eukprot:8964439-Prorocentrum_lima.AAC.1